MERSGMRRLASLASLILGFLLTITSPGAYAFSAGISGYSGKDGVDCTACHTTTGFPDGLITITGPNAVDAGALASYTLQLGMGEAFGSGVDLAASGGTLIDTNASGTQILNGELTHTAPFPDPFVTLTFDWRAPATPGTYTFYAAGLGTDLGGDPAFDDTYLTTFTVTVGAANVPPTAVITSLSTVEAGQVITLNGRGSNDPDGTIVSYAWDFGDGTTGTGIQVDHAWATPGTYTVTLTVTDDKGATGTDTKVITVTAPTAPKPPVANPGGPYSGIVNIPVQFDGSGSTDPDGTIVSYAWDFGDGSTGTGATPTHAYTAAGVYTVTLTVTDNDGLTGSATTEATIVVPAPPVADPGGPYSGVVGQPVSFDGSQSMDPDGTIVSYRWFFGDNAQGTGPTPVHTYAAAGTYTVTLTVTDNDGLRDTAATTVTITDATPPPPPAPPVADAGGPYTGTTGMPVQMDGSASTDPDGTIVSYAWDFGDGSTGTGATPTHSYAAAGVYTVTLTVTDSDGLSASATTTASIADPAPPPPPPPAPMPPVADAGGPYTGTTGTAVMMDGSGSADPDGTIVSYAWDFGDGTTGTGVTPSHAYAMAGTYTVTLTVTDNDGLTATATTTATITDPVPPPPPPPGDTPPPGEPPAGDLNGAMLYARNCAACHGGNGLGGSSGESVVGASPADIMKAIQENEGGMGSLAGLTPEQIAAISDWLNRGIKEKKEKKLHKKGKKKYKKYCAACHGKKGTGGDSAGSIVGEGREDILRAIRDVPEMNFLDGLLGSDDAAAIAEFLDYRAEKERRKRREKDEDDEGEDENENGDDHRDD